ncbi:BnaC02g19530D [Brassica napus]|uniref:BnaC02g19530D protein n=1 Tax=Brassica napus TaxID=3708 RepID=A0A078I079_BRANA|nr:BnaC02g19530D [Brassica napus]
MIIKRQSTRDVREYLQIVLNRFPDNCEIYDKITKLLKDLRLARVRSTYNDVISKVSQLFKEHKVLLLGFNKFLPPGYKITLPKDQTQRRKPEFRDAAEFINKVKERLQDEHAYNLTEVHHEVLYALRDHQDLCVDFAAFLPARYR